jgi:SAM-dependent methyltransferase
MEYSDGHTPNWRERLNCETCGLNTRLRMCLDVFMALNVRGQASRAYITEQVTSTYTLLRKRCETVGSEYIGGGLSSGEVRNGIRNEDLTALSFEDRSFDLVLTFDVLEHIPQAGAALTEIARVLKPDGWLVLTAPFDVNARKNLRRAYIDESGTTVHLESPDYHGDPINPDVGILCYWWFGWELLSDLRAAGFSDAAVLTAWSAEAGYLGQSLPMVVARR